MSFLRTTAGFLLIVGFSIGSVMSALYLIERQAIENSGMLERTDLDR